jgi:serine/threonine protein kinase
MVEPQALIAGRYRLLRRVGSGGMGVVWEGWDERLERRVGLKQLYRQSGTSTREAELANQRAMREARLTARLQHPHAVAVFDAVEQDGQLWLIMQFIPSITLAAVLEEGGPLQPNEAAKVGSEVASALAAAHAVGIVHRDVKPGNILIADDGSAMISDFGIARALGDATLTSSGMIHGTPAYLAPEVARGSEADFASDVFSLGSTLYSAMEGRPPFGTDDNTMALLHRVASGQFPPPAQSGPLTPLIMDMLSIDTDARPSMHAVVETLARLAARGRSEEPALAPGVPEEAPKGEEGDPGLSKTTPSAGSGAESQQSTGPPPTAAPETPVVSAPAIQRPAEPQRRRGLAAAVAVVALIGIGILVTALLLNDRRAGNPTAAPAQSSSAAPASTSVPTAPSSSAPSATSSTPSPTTKASAPQEGPAPKPTQRTTARTPTRAPSPTTAPTVLGTPTAAELRRAIASYYALMPRNTDAAWPRMTASYQTNHAGGRQAYQRFWDAISKITVANVKGIPPDSAQATLTYYFKDGRVVRERTAYGLVNEGGRLKISSSTVLSSVTLSA